MGSSQSCPKCGGEVTFYGRRCKARKYTSLKELCDGSIWECKNHRCGYISCQNCNRPER